MKHLLAILFFSSLSAAQSAWPIGPDGGLTAFTQYARDLRSNERVLFVAYMPGMEDLHAIARARAERGARVHLAYVTNGDGSQDGTGAPYPNQIAERRRERAFTVATIAGADHTFLNLPYIDAASRVERVWAEWHPDTVRDRWSRLVSDAKPDAVYLNGLEGFGNEHPIVRVLLGDIGAATRRAQRSGEWTPIRIAMGVDRLTDAAAERATRTSELLSMLAGVYPELHGGVPRMRYREIVVQRDSVGRTIRETDLKAPRRLPAQLVPIDSTIQSIARSLTQVRSIPAGEKAMPYLRRIVDAMRMVDMEVAMTPRFQEAPRRFLLDWKQPLENMRSMMLGVRVHWSMSEKILAPLQLSYLQIDTVTGLSPGGRTEIFVPAVLRGWILNEGMQNHTAYQAGESIRILSGKDLPLDLPRSLEGLSRQVYRDPWYFFVLHRAETAERSFSYRVTVDVTHAPRFSAEILTPIVQVVDGERLAFRLTNHSRDGVKDTVAVLDPRVSSSSSSFRLYIKDDPHTDTLTLDWAEDLSEGPHILDVSIGGEPVATFVARKFSVTAPRREVTVVTENHASGIIPALRRLGMLPTVISPDRFDGAVMGQQGLVIVDQDLGGVSRPVPRFWEALLQWSDGGGTAVVLSQTASTMQASGLFPQTVFRQTFLADTSYSLKAVDERLFAAPNDLSSETWEGWLYRVASNVIKAPSTGVHVRASLTPGDDPVIISRPVGRGTVTYCDLNLMPQLVNVSPPAYRLLANIVAAAPTASEGSQ